MTRPVDSLLEILPFLRDFDAAKPPRGRSGNSASPWERLAEAALLNTRSMRTSARFGYLP